MWEVLTKNEENRQAIVQGFLPVGLRRVIEVHFIFNVSSRYKVVDTY